ncbi:MAG TPA: ribosomal protein S18-alanine N-acetyltransferase [Gemmatimonadota bacterium]|nr:ribosomal protein S18-alanine N-acetyltransferase [Gemmatimonadota bacterium]
MRDPRSMRADAQMPKPVEFRPWREDDLEAVCEIERRTFPLPWTREQFRDLFAHPAGLGWIAVGADGRVVGYAIGWVAADEAELADLAVSDELRNQGIGAVLVRAFAREAGVRGARRLYLEVRVSNQAAQRFYERLGFGVVGRRTGYYRNPPEDGLAMALDLPMSAG